MIIPAAEVFCEPLLHQQDKARGELLTLGLGSQHDGGLSLFNLPIVSMAMSSLISQARIDFSKSNDLILLGDADETVMTIDH